MNVTVTQLSPILVKAEISLPWDTVAPHYSKSMKSVAKHAQIPGFRKGKIPAGMLRKRYEGHILNEVAQAIMPETLEKVIKDENLKVVGQPNLTDIDLQYKADLALTLEMELMPEVEIKDWKGLEAEALNISVSDQDVEDRLAELIEQKTHRHNVEDRAAEDGDTIVYSMTVIDEESGDVIFDEENLELVKGKEGNHPHKEEILAALKPGEDGESNIEAADDDQDEAWRGKKLKVYAEVASIYTIHRPELNDEFAKGFDVENLDALREKTKKDLEESTQEEETNRLNGVLIEQVLERNNFDIPPSLVEAEAQQMVQQQMMPYMQMLDGRDQASKRSFFESMLEYTRPQAAAKARMELALESLAEQLNIEVADEEINDELEKMKEYFSQGEEEKTVEELRKEFEERGSMEGLVTFLKRRAASEALRKEAKLTFVDELTVPESAEDSEDAEDTAAETVETDAPAEETATAKESES